MARMLYLRDIDVDVQLRCCACGHEGVLPRAVLVRRFGPSYPILSLAPHFRCSRCNSRNVESRPAPRDPVSLDNDPSLRTDAPEASVDEPLAMLQGLLSSVRASRPEKSAQPEEPKAGEATPWRMEFPSWAPISMSELDALAENDPEDQEPEEPEDETEEPFADEDEPVIPRAFFGEARDEEDDAKEDDAEASTFPEDEAPPAGSLENTLASLREILEAEDEHLGRQPPRQAAPPPSARDAEPQSRPEPEFKPEEIPEGHAGLGRSRVRDEDRNDNDRDYDRDAPAPAFSPSALVRDDFEEEDDRQDEGWNADKKTASSEEDLSTEDILGFAIRDPERRTEEQELMPWERDRPPPSPDDEPMDKTIETLRGMVERAAAEPGMPVPGRETRSTAPRKPSAAADGKVPFADFMADAGGTSEEPAPKPAKDAKQKSPEEGLGPLPSPAAEEKEASEPDVSFLDLMKSMSDPPPKPAANSAFEKTIATLRSMLELDGKRRR